jgi:hypothetical protein
VSSITGANGVNNFQMDKKIKTVPTTQNIFKIFISSELIFCKKGKDNKGGYKAA